MRSKKNKGEILTEEQWDNVDQRIAEDYEKTYGKFFSISIASQA